MGITTTYNEVGQIVSIPSVTSRDDHPLIKTGQPPCIITLTEELLALANDHERHEYHRYRWLSLRFLTYHRGISKLMQALAGESQQRVQALIEAAASLPIREPVLRDPATQAWQAPSIQSHFFIFDDDVAAQELSRALLEEWRSRRFYERLQACNGIPDLHAWLNACIGQTRSQFQILQEVEGQLPALPCPPRAITRPAVRHAPRRRGLGGRSPRPGPGATTL